MSNPEIITGTVKWFNAEKGFGFITTADHGDLFVHLRALAQGQTALTVGEQVHFHVRQTEKGAEAANVRLGLPPPPPKPALPTVELDTPAILGRAHLRIVGRPAEVRELGWPGKAPSLMACVFEIGGELASALPGGLPLPSAATACVVLMKTKHWQRFSSMLAADPDDTLVIDGYLNLDPLAPGMIMLRATELTTMKLMDAKRAAQALAREALAQEAAAAAAAEAEAAATTADEAAAAATAEGSGGAAAEEAAAAATAEGMAAEEAAGEVV